MRGHGDAGFAAFLGAVQQVVGAGPARVSVELEKPFAEAWEAVGGGIATANLTDKGKEVKGILW